MSAAKKSANLSVRADLLEEARAYEINLPQMLEAALQVGLKMEKERRWLEENVMATRTRTPPPRGSRIFSNCKPACAARCRPRWRYRSDCPR